MELGAWQGKRDCVVQCSDGSCPAPGLVLAALSPAGVTARPAKIKEPELRQMAIVLRAALDREEPFTIM